MLKSAALQDGQAKITDVGMAKLMSEAYFTQDASFGTFSWAAPEVLLGERQARHPHSNTDKDT